ncbi:MAG: hypothetical protein Q8Q09_27840 [Deltaproteobacteria bacterium]|nr:hypothetical protein [Deltaproteobacteria bacterium]
MNEHAISAQTTLLTMAPACETSDESLDATETMMEETELSGSPALIAFAQRAAAERDGLRSEIHRIREAFARLESQSRMGKTPSRETAELRETLELRDREVRRLKDANIARERLLTDARNRLDEALHQRAAAVAKLDLRERGVSAIESALEEHKHELLHTRRRVAQLEIELHRAVQSERGLSAMLEDTRGQLSEARQSLETLHSELSDTREALTMSNDAAVSREEALRAERARLDAQRAEEILVEMERREELSAELEALSVRHVHELALSESRAEESLEVTRKEANERLAALCAHAKEDLAAAHVGYSRGLQFALHEQTESALAAREALCAWHAGELLGQRFALQERVVSERDQHTATRARFMLELNAMTQDCDRMVEEHALTRSELTATLEGTTRGLAFVRAETQSEVASERALRMAEATRHGQAMNALREAHERSLCDQDESSEFAATALRTRIARETERARKLEGELEASAQHRDQCAELVAAWLTARDESIAYLQADRAELRALYEEADAVRERLAQASVDAAKQARGARERAESAERQLLERTQAISATVGILTRVTVEQHAVAGALRHKRALPTMADVDAAIAAVTQRVPEEIGEELWLARDAIAAAIFAGPSID